MQEASYNFAFFDAHERYRYRSRSSPPHGGSRGEITEGYHSMLDIDIEEALIQKVGGKFKLTSLIQKRLVELNRGARPLIKLDSKDQGRDLRQVVYQEILQDKIQLAPREEVGYSIEEERARISAGLPAASVGEEPEIYGSDIKKIKEQRIKELAQLLNNPKE